MFSFEGTKKCCNIIMLKTINFNETNGSKSQKLILYMVAHQSYSPKHIGELDIRVFFQVWNGLPISELSKLSLNLWQPNPIVSKQKLLNKFNSL